MKTTIAGIKSKFKIHHNRNQSDSRLAENWPKKFSMYVKQRLRMETMAAIDTATDSKRPAAAGWFGTAAIMGADYQLSRPVA